jgi:hypothetical protein
VTLRQLADRRPAGVVDADRDELDERALGRIDHPERGVPRADQLPPGLGDVRQEHRQLEIGTQRHHGIEQPPQLPRASLTSRHRSSPGLVARRTRRILCWRHPSSRP